MYIAPTIPPFIIPFFLIFIELITLPIRILIADIIIIVHMADTADKAPACDSDNAAQALHTIGQLTEIVLKPLLNLFVLCRPVIQALADLDLIRIRLHALILSQDIFLIFCRIFVSDCFFLFFF